MQYDDTLDAQHLLCPLPVLKARKKLSQMQTNKVLRVLTTDPAASIDIPHFCHESGHILRHHAQADGHEIFYIEKS